MGNIYGKKCWKIIPTTFAISVMAGLTLPTGCSVKASVDEAVVGTDVKIIVNDLPNGYYVNSYIIYDEVGDIYTYQLNDTFKMPNKDVVIGAEIKPDEDYKATNDLTLKYYFNNQLVQTIVKEIPYGTLITPSDFMNEDLDYFNNITPRNINNSINMVHDTTYEYDCVGIKSAKMFDCLINSASSKNISSKFYLNTNFNLSIKGGNRSVVGNIKTFKGAAITLTINNRSQKFTSGVGTTFKPKDTLLKSYPYICDFTSNEQFNSNWYMSSEQAFNVMFITELTLWVEFEKVPEKEFELKFSRK